MSRITLYDDDFSRIDQDLNRSPWTTPPMFQPMVISGQTATAPQHQGFYAARLEEDVGQTDQWVEGILAVPVTTGNGGLVINALQGHQQHPNSPENSLSLVLGEGSVGQQSVALNAYLNGEDNILWTGTGSSAPGTAYALEVTNIQSGILTATIYIGGSQAAVVSVEAHRERLIGRSVGMVHTGLLAVGTPAAWQSFGAGYLGSSLSIVDVNGDDVIRSGGTIEIRVSGGENVDTVQVSDGTSVEFLAIVSTGGTSITCSPIDIHNTEFSYGPLTLTVAAGGDSDSHSIQLLESLVQQYEAISGAISGGITTGITGFSNNDLIEIPRNVGNSQLTLKTNGDVWHDPAVPDNTSYTRWWYNRSGRTWDSGSVTIARDVAVADPPVWISVPNPPAARAGEAYYYDLSGLIRGMRPLTLAEAGNPLPSGLAYDSSINREAITGTPPPNIGEVTVTGIITRATNDDGSAESAPFTLRVTGFPVLSNPYYVGVSTSGADVGCVTDQALGQLYLVADTLAAEPTASQIMAGRNANGVKAAASSSHAISGAGTQGPFTVIGFSPNTGVSFWFVQSDSRGTISNVVGQRFVTHTDETVVPPEQQQDRLVSFYNRTGTYKPAEVDHLLESNNDSETDTPDHLVAITRSPASGADT